MDTSTIITIIEKYALGSLSPEEETLLAAWLRDVSPEEFHRTLDQCTRLPEGFREYRGISPAFVRRMESLLDAADGQGVATGPREAGGLDVMGGPGEMGRSNEGMGAGEVAGTAEGDGSEENGRVVVLNDRSGARSRNEGRRWNGARRWMAAAAVILLLSAGIFLLVRKTAGPAVVAVSEHKKQDAEPGHDGAILTLADGQQIVLDSVGNGALAMQGNVKIQKLSSGVVKYDNGLEGRKETLYNTLTTPRGRKTSLSLTDGTVVWLNASSSIRYPTVFTGKERLVEVTGEAYFEVAKNSAMPFVVRKAGNDERVEVLGTSFDINVYDDEEAAKTTLLEGSIKVIKGADGRVLKPGQQAVLGKGGSRMKIVSDVDAEEVMAWKNGRFQFNDADLRTIMRQLMRWYDVDVVYEGDVPVRYFTADVSRNKNLSSVLKILELSKIHFRIEGKKLIVTP